jgi:hypothetical protein
VTDEKETKEIETVINDVLEIFAAHNVQPGTAMSALAILTLVTAAQIREPYAEVFNAYFKCLLLNKAEFYDDCREDTTEWPPS